MSVFEEFLKKHCPDGVEYKTLSEIGEFSNIGVDKKKVDGEKEILLLNFIDVMKNMYIDKSIPKMVVTASDYKIEKCTIEEGDIFITPSSETIDEIGFASVITETIPNACYSYHIMRFRLFEYNMTTSIFIRYCFDSSFLRKQIRKSAQGITRFGLTLNKWKSLKIPFPPIEVQEEIVRILDEFTEKTTKLQELLHRETILRKKQYEYYRDKLLTFGDDVPLKKLGDIAIDIYRGTGIKKDEVTEKGIPCVRYGEIYTKYNIWFDKCFSHTIEENIKNRKYFEYGDVLFAITGESVKEISKSCVYIGHDKCLAGGDIVVLKHNQNPKYMGYVLSTTNAQIQKSKGKVKSKVVHSNVQDISDILIPVPPLEEQERIVKILDQFDTLCNDITRGLPAEIELRKKQYEYYRDKLLTFKEKKK